MVGDAINFNKSDEISRSEAGEGGFGELGIGGEKIIRSAMKVGEIAASTARDEDFLAETISAFKDGDATAALPCFDGAEKAGGSSTENDGIEFAR